ncbi:n-acetylmuramoyl-L-alanine amidase [Histomonas meleagridis]|uniref:n-acetylmuramoyl-L-alanine amidase n=1 Tax=Histomonas meleagridis TaxID=135588 RepID=UPI0035598414|nr:n-acetylmuramoyl-L-alanine amidase [Histomonas meleagridis]KAH0804859.1 n-acetylmuramoyl-L-alanine amidase [Histomonas meleagridis]
MFALLLALSTSAKVCIDPGHAGKYNKGAVSTYYESEVVWKLSNKLKTQLQNKGISVVMTKSSLNDDPSLEKRGNTAKGCNLFISIHSNACGTESVDYPLVITSLDNSGGVNTLSTNIANSLHSLMGTRQAGKVITKQGSGGEWYGVLRGAQHVGVANRILVEHSFHTNVAAANWLLVDSNLDKIASMEANHISNFIGDSPSPSPSCTVAVGKSVTLSNANLYTDSYAGTYARKISGTYTVSRVISGRAAGVLIGGGIGWVRESDCKC